MNITYYELTNLKTLKNYVLTEPIVDTSEVVVGDKKLYIDTSYRPELFQPLIHKVISVPKKLIYGKKTEMVNIGGNRSEQKTDGSWFNYKYDEYITRKEPIPNSMPWKTDMLLKKGDIVWLGYFSILRAPAENREIVCEGKKYYLIPYQDIYLKKTDDSVTMLNGWILLAPIKMDDEAIVSRLRNLGILLPSFAKESDKFAEVRYVGLPVEEYIESHKHDTDEISVGDTVRLNWAANRRLECETHKFFSQEELIVSRRTNIAGVLRNMLF